MDDKILIDDDLQKILLYYVGIPRGSKEAQQLIEATLIAIDTYHLAFAADKGYHPRDNRRNRRKDQQSHIKRIEKDCANLIGSLEALFDDLDSSKDCREIMGYLKATPTDPAFIDLGTNAYDGWKQTLNQLRHMQEHCKRMETEAFRKPSARSLGEFIFTLVRIFDIFLYADTATAREVNQRRRKFVEVVLYIAVPQLRTKEVSSHHDAIINKAVKESARYVQINVSERPFWIETLFPSDYLFR